MAAVEALKPIQERWNEIEDILPVIEKFVQYKPFSIQYSSLSGRAQKKYAREKELLLPRLRASIPEESLFRPTGANLVSCMKNGKLKKLLQGILCVKWDCRRIRFTGGLGSMKSPTTSTNLLLLEHIVLKNILPLLRPTQKLLQFPHKAGLPRYHRI